MTMRNFLWLIVLIVTGVIIETATSDGRDNSIASWFYLKKFCFFFLTNIIKNGRKDNQFLLRTDW